MNPHHGATSSAGYSRRGLKRDRRRGEGIREEEEVEVEVEGEREVEEVRGMGVT